MRLEAVDRHGTTLTTQSFPRIVGLPYLIRDVVEDVFIQSANDERLRDLIRQSSRTPDKNTSICSLLA